MSTHPRRAQRRAPTFAVPVFHDTKSAPTIVQLEAVLAHPVGLVLMMRDPDGTLQFGISSATGLIWTDSLSAALAELRARGKIKER